MKRLPYMPHGKYGRYIVLHPINADDAVRRIVILAGGYNPLPTEPEAIALHNEETIAMHHALRAIGACVTGVEL